MTGADAKKVEAAAATANVLKNVRKIPPLAEAMIDDHAAAPSGAALLD